MTPRNWAGTIVLPVAVGVMIGCIALSLVSLVERFVGGLRPSFLALFCGVTALEALYSYQLRHDHPLLSRRLPLQILEVGSLCILRPLWGDIIAGQMPLSAGVPRIDLQASAGFILPSGLIVLAWLVATALARDVGQMSEHSYAGVWYRDPDPEARLCAWVLGGGIFLFIVAGLTQQNVARMFGLTTGPVLNVLLYFLAGLLVLAYAQHARLQARQRNHKIALEPGFSGRALQLTAIPAAVVIGLALLLPTGSTGSLVDAGHGALDGAVSILPRSSSPPTHPDAHPSYLSDTPVRPVHPNPEETHPPPATTPSRWDINLSPLVHHLASALGVLLLWLIVLGSVAFRVRKARKRRGHDQKPSVSINDILTGMWEMWLTFWHSLRNGHAIVGVRSRVEARTTERAPQSTPGSARISKPKACSPREQILHAYLSIVRHATRRGFQRHASQTPHEFTATVAPALHGAEGDLEMLTEAFVEARYSRHDMDPAKAAQVRAGRRRLGMAIRRARPASMSESPTSGDA